MRLPSRSHCEKICLRRTYATSANKKAIPILMDCLTVVHSSTHEPIQTFDLGQLAFDLAGSGKLDCDLDEVIPSLLKSWPDPKCYPKTSHARLLSLLRLWPKAQQLSDSLFAFVFAEASSLLPPDQPQAVGADTATPQPNYTRLEQALRFFGVCAGLLDLDNALKACIDRDRHLAGPKAPAREEVGPPSEIYVELTHGLGRSIGHAAISYAVHRLRSQEATEVVALLKDAIEFTLRFPCRVSQRQRIFGTS